MIWKQWQEFWPESKTPNLLSSYFINVTMSIFDLQQGIAYLEREGERQTEREREIDRDSERESKT